MGRRALISVTQGDVVPPDPDTLSKVIHGRAERAFGAERSEAVNNFAEMNFESNLRPGNNGSGRKAGVGHGLLTLILRGLSPEHRPTLGLLSKSLRELHPKRVSVSGRLTIRAKGQAPTKTL